MKTCSFKVAAVPARIVLCALTTATASAAVDQLNPGLYEVTTQLVYGDLPMPPTSITTKQCITEAALQESLSKAMATLPIAQNCETVELDVGGGSIAMQLSCAAPTASVMVMTTGNYTDNNYSLKSNITISGSSMDMEIVGDISGRRIGDC